MAEEEVAAAADGPCFTHSTYELTDEGCVHLHIDAQHMGVGGHDSWSFLRTVRPS